MRHNRFFPQDELWRAASEVKLTLVKINGRWCTEFRISGIIGHDPFEDEQNEEEDDSDLMERKSKMDHAELIRSIVADLMREQATTT